jgi:uncharacterized membrane protein
MIKWLIQMNKGREDGERDSRAVEILKDCYIKGEIDKSQFETMEADLRH